MIPSGPEWIVTWPDIGGAIGALIIIGAAVWAVRRFVHPIMVRISLVAGAYLLTGAGQRVTTGVPWAWANQDQLRLSITYEAGA